MRKILLAAITAASLLAVPAFAQVDPGAHAASSHAGTTATGTAAGSHAGSPTGTQPLGLGGLLKQTQAGSSQTRADDGSADGAEDDGAGPLGSLDAKARAKKARAHGH